MLSTAEAVEKFKTLITNEPSWAILADSQFVDHLATFCAWALRDAQFKSERDRQEFFLSTSINKSSIQAHAEDREYIPLKPTPASGTISIENKGTSAVSVPSGTEFVTGNDITLTTTQAVTIAASATVAIPAQQKEKILYSYTVDTTKAFFECLFPIEKTLLISDFSVYVTDPFNNTEPYFYYRLLQNTYPETLAYDEFYTHNGQIGIRFGNGNFGFIPLAGSVVKIYSWETQGDIYIASGQKVYPITAIVSTDTLTYAVGTAFSGGSSAEDIESIRTNLHYWQTYNNEMVWDEDYKYFLKRKFQDILFVNAWGEAEQEEQEGAANLDYVNKIYISAYAETDNHTEWMDALDAVRPLNRRFEYVPVNHVTWSISVSGNVLDDISLTDAEAAIRLKLEEYYGKNSTSRRENVYTNEIYDLIIGTGYFVTGSGARFNLTTSGITEPSQLQDMVSIDLSTSTITLSYR